MPMLQVVNLCLILSLGRAPVIFLFCATVMFCAESPALGEFSYTRHVRATLFVELSMTCSFMMTSFNELIMRFRLYIRCQYAT